jgi:PAS domain S-box-containing protein
MNDQSDIKSIKSHTSLEVLCLDETFKEVVENAYMPICFFENEKVVYANLAFRSLFINVDMNTWSSQKWLEIATPDTRVDMEKRLELLKAGKQVPEVFLGSFNTSKGIRSLETQARSFVTGNRQLRMGVITDITDHVKLRNELNDVQHIFEQAQIFANLGSWRIVMESGEIRGSENIYKIYGLNKDAELSDFDTFFSKVHPEDQPTLSAILTKCFSDLQPFENEHRVVWKNGEIRWILARGAALSDNKGKGVEMYGFVWDVTKAKAAALEVEQNKARYQLLAEEGQELICLHSLDGRYLYASPALQALLGLNPGKIPESLRSIDLVHADDRQRFEQLWSDAIDSKNNVVSGRFRFKHSKGKYIWCEKNLKAVADKSDSVLAIRSLTRNIDQQVLFETKLQDTNVQLEKALLELKEATKTKENFLSIMSHEIRTPLNSVIGLSNLLSRRKPREDQAEIVKTLKYSADNLMHLVNDILDFSKIQSGKVLLETIPFSLVDFIKQLHASFQLSARDKGLELNFQIDPRIPVVVEGDVTRLNQVVTNLLTNAIKFTHEGAVKFEAMLDSVSRQECSVLFKVEDTGVGIAPEKLDSIFQPFQQSDSNTTRKYGGTGLGLSIVKSLTELMNGEITLASTLGRGSVFSLKMNFKLPGKTFGKKPALGTGTVVATHIRRKPIHVLYVEDVESNRFLIENVLSDNNLSCTSVSSGQAALRLTAAKKYDIILMDLQMPVMDGFEAIKQIKKQAGGKNKNTRTIAFTAEPYSEELKGKTSAAGFHDIMTKPFDDNVLLEKINAPTTTPGTPKAASFFSFSFYEEAFNHDPKQLIKIRKSVMTDITRFHKKLQLPKKSKDMEVLRKEVHRIKPIIKNLKCHTLVNVLDQFNAHKTHSKEMKPILEKVKPLVSRLQSKLADLKWK